MIKSSWSPVVRGSFRNDAVGRIAKVFGRFRGRQPARIGRMSGYGGGSRPGSLDNGQHRSIRCAESLVSAGQPAQCDRTFRRLMLLFIIGVSQCLAFRDQADFTLSDTLPACGSGVRPHIVPRSISAFLADHVTEPGHERGRERDAETDDKTLLGFGTRTMR